MIKENTFQIVFNLGFLDTLHLGVSFGKIFYNSNLKFCAYLLNIVAMNNIVASALVLT